jgi:uncharacterized protein YdhG (YjbR/CyaY superfamily)
MDGYIEAFSDDVRGRLTELRRRFHAAVPGLTETISYQMPTFILDGRPLVYLAAWKRYISLYPAPSGDETFEREVAAYRAQRSTLRFPHNQPMPYDLIDRVLELLVRLR